MINVQETIKILCVKRRMSITALAEKLGTTKQNLYNKMHRNNMKISELEKIMDVLNCNMEIIITDKTSKEKML